MCSISRLRGLVLGNVSEGELVQAVISINVSLDAVNGEEDCPGDEPYRKKNSDHDAEESSVKIGVEPVCSDDIPVVRLHDPYRP